MKTTLLIDLLAPIYYSAHRAWAAVEKSSPLRVEKTWHRQLAPVFKIVISRCTISE